MVRTSNDPAGAGTPNRADILGTQDSGQDNKTTPVYESAASRWLVRQSNLPPSRAALIANQAVLGETAPPILRAFHVAGSDDWAVWCTGCGRIHRHSAGDGLRTAHCNHSSSSPYRSAGYILRYAGEVEDVEQVRPETAYLALDRPYGNFQPGQAALLRAALLRVWFGSGRTRKVGSIVRTSRKIDGGRRLTASMCLTSAEWWVELRGDDGADLATANGHGLISFGATLFGISPERLAADLAIILGGK